MRLAVFAFVAAFVLFAHADSATARTCPGGGSNESATWYSILHPGLGEWYLKGWGGFWGHAPQKKFWLGFIPIYGWPGYLQAKSAIDANHCRTNDELHG
jgi:hypothetical protein